jgi:hypothetical protein
MKTRTITLTDRRPVKIVEDEWPIIAKATGDSWSGGDYARHEPSRKVSSMSTICGSGSTRMGGPSSMACSAERRPGPERTTGRVARSST